MLSTSRLSSFLFLNIYMGEGCEGVLIAWNWLHKHTNKRQGILPANSSCTDAVALNLQGTHKQQGVVQRARTWDCTASDTLTQAFPVGEELGNHDVKSLPPQPDTTSRAAHSSVLHLHATKHQGSQQWLLSKLFLPGKGLRRGFVTSGARRRSKARCKVTSCVLDSLSAKYFLKLILIL